MSVIASCATPTEPSATGADPPACTISCATPPPATLVSHCSTSRSNALSWARATSKPILTPPASACSSVCLISSSDEWIVPFISFCSVVRTSASSPSISASTSSLV
jgi:hypothetical protein